MPAKLRVLSPASWLSLLLLLALEVLVWSGAEASRFEFYVPLLLLLGCALLFSWRQRSLTDLQIIFSKPVFLFLFVIVSVVWLGLLFIKYRSLQFAVFDTGIYTNILSNLSNHKEFYSGVHQTHALSNHFTPILALVAPLYGMKPHVLWLPTLKIFAFLSCVWPLLLLSRDILGKDSRFLFTASSIWLLHRYVVFSMDTEFQVSALSVPLVLLAFWLAKRERWVALFSVLFLLLGFKENLALVWVSVGLYLIIFQNKFRKGSAITILGILFGALIYFFVMPSFGNAYELSHAYRLGIFVGIWQKLECLFFGLLSLAFLPLFAPRSLFFILPLYALTFLSGEPNMWTYHFHYQDLALCGLFVGSIYGLKNIVKFFEARDGMNALQGLLLITLIVLMVRFHNRTPAQFLQDRIEKVDVKLFEEVVALESSLSRTEEVFSLNSLGAYFARSPALTLIRKPDSLKELPPYAKVVLSENVSKWPLSPKEYSELRHRIERKVRRGKLRRVEEFERLVVYERNFEKPPSSED